jgi:serine/threonine protein phosphatase PrpC
MSSSSSSVPADIDSWLGYAVDKNARDHMEDFVAVRLVPGGGIFVVLDGHNGSSAVDFVAEHLIDNILEGLDTNIESALTGAFAKTERELQTFLAAEPTFDSGMCSPTSSGICSPSWPKLTSGVVVCVVVILGGKITTAHVGDSRAVLGRSGKSIQLTADHNVTNVGERKRVADIMCPDGYVNGLMVTRSLGNFRMCNLEKVEGQIAIPSCSTTSIDPTEDAFLIIASDGLFEVMSSEVATSTVFQAMKRPSFSPNSIANDLVKKAISRGSCDNICVCIVMLGEGSLVA